MGPMHCLKNTPSLVQTLGHDHSTIIIGLDLTLLQGKLQALGNSIPRHQFIHEGCQIIRSPVLHISHKQSSILWIWLLAKRHDWFVSEIIIEVTAHLIIKVIRMLHSQPKTQFQQSVHNNVYSRTLNPGTPNLVLQKVVPWLMKPLSYKI